MEHDLVSVVITTRQEEKNLPFCLASLRIQTHPRIEVIVVDNGSTDETCEIALAHTPHVYQMGPERSAQRNFGMIQKSTGKYVLYLDADMVIAPTLIADSVAFMEQGYIALYLSEIVLGKRYFSSVRRFERRFYDGTAVDCARFFLREAFIQTGGFDETLSGPEDWDLDKKIRQLGKVALLQASNSGPADWQETQVAKELESFVRERGVKPESFRSVVFHNEAEFDLGKYLGKKSYYAKSFNAYIAKWGKNDPDLRRQFGFWYRFFGVFLENGKWRRLLSRPDLAFGLYFLRFLVGLRFLFRD
ncbi:MAG: glycosyltransferase family 2 protein [Spirochaetia bacterium]|nr:glycosyltransferase family 2 protein [Spirochaetia bacterium]